MGEIVGWNADPRVLDSEGHFSSIFLGKRNLHRSSGGSEFESVVDQVFK
jgi:hypothetical protein